MTAGKIASQAGHAFLDAYRQCLQIDAQRAAIYHGEHHGIKICLKAKSLSALERAHADAIRLNLPNALVIDLGYTQFCGVPTITALGIGPVRKDEIREITKRFSLMD